MIILKTKRTLQNFYRMSFTRNIKIVHIYLNDKEKSTEALKILYEDITHIYITPGVKRSD